MGAIKSWVAGHRKAIAGGILTGAGAGVAAAVAGSTWQIVIVAAAAGALGVNFVPNRTGNKPAPAGEAQPPHSPR